MKLGNNLNTDTTWDVYETEYVPDQGITMGSNFMVGNGYLGYRGTFADDTATDYVGCVVTDTYDNADGVWKELVTAPNGLYTTITVDGTRLRWGGGDGNRRDHYRRALDFRYGEWSAEREWGREGVRVVEERFASQSRIHLLTSQTVITALREVEIVIETGIDGTVWSLNGDHFASRTGLRDGDDLEVAGVTGEHGYDVVVRERARLTDDEGCTIPEEQKPDRDTRADADGSSDESSDESGDHSGTTRLRRFRITLAPGGRIALTKRVAIYSTNDLRTVPNPHTRVTVPESPAAVGTLDPAKSAAEARRHDVPPADPERPSLEAVRAAAVRELDRASERSWDELRHEHRAVWDRRRRTGDITIEGDDLAQTVLRYNLYHNFIATPAHTDHLPIGARGLSCQAYQGAAFWDQEVFNLPMFMYTAPEIARKILIYRYRTLDGARRKARDLGYNGAFYAWISGDSGEEICPAYFFRDLVSGRRIRNHFNDWQIHISPDIAYTIQRYLAVTGDYEYLRRYGSEIVFEVARFIASRVHFRPDRNRYEIIRVLGPDEYHENVDNNFFTNFQARFAAAYAVEVYEWMAREAVTELADLTDRIGLNPEEVATWRDLANRIYVPEVDGATGLIEQFAGFFQLEDVTPEEIKKRLIEPGEYWGWPNGIAFETQVSKQADVTQLFVLHPTAYDREVMKANWEYYEPRTQHGSSLSPAVYAIVAAWVGHMEEAKRYFMKSCTIDLLSDNKAISGGTFIGGIHTAACGISWQIVVSGFAGMYVTHKGFGFRPHLPAEWRRITFSLRYRGNGIDVAIRRGDGDAGMAPVVEVTAHEGNEGAVAIEREGRRVTVSPGAEATL
ncbi:MAG: glycosyl hydrolase family 65 protein [Alkalispirochaeta sp.]